MSKLKSKDARENRDREFSVVSETGEVRWVQIMKKFSEANKETCKQITVDIPRVKRSLKTFPTGSEYEGSWDVLGMSGYGIYTFPHGNHPDEKILRGPMYEGEFQDGNFHGDGEIHYGCGTILKGKWKNGQISERRLIFADGLEYFSDKWKYCQMSDRRYTVEYDHGMEPAGKSYLTATQPTPELPEGCYDTGDGFYDPKTISVYRYDDPTTIIRTPSMYEQKWIEQNCRKRPDKSVGPQLELYEEWQEPYLEMEPVPLPSCPTLATPIFHKEEDDDEDENRAVLEGFKDLQDFQDFQIIKIFRVTVAKKHGAVRQAASYSYATVNKDPVWVYKIQDSICLGTKIKGYYVVVPRENSGYNRTVVLEVKKKQPTPNVTFQLKKGF